MWPDPQETVNLVRFTEKSLIENFIFCALKLLRRFTQTAFVSTMQILNFWGYTKYSMCHHGDIPMVPHIEMLLKIENLKEENLSY